MSSRAKKILALVDNKENNQPSINSKVSENNLISQNIVSAKNIISNNFLALETSTSKENELRTYTILSEGNLVNKKYTQILESGVEIKRIQDEPSNMDMLSAKNQTALTDMQLVDESPDANVINWINKSFPTTAHTVLTDKRLLESSTDIIAIKQTNNSLPTICQTFFTDTQLQENRSLETAAVNQCNVSPPIKSQTLLHDSLPNKSFAPETLEQSEDPEGYVIESRSSTKLSLRRVTEKTYRECSSSENEDFSSGSSDNFIPSIKNSSRSLNSSPSLSSSSSATDSEINNPFASEEKPDSPVKGKKRVRNMDNWVKVKAKRLKNSGKEYTSRTGNVVKARSMKPPCPDKCILSCSKKFLEDFRRQLFEEYWGMANLQRQRGFLSSCIEQLELKYRRISSAVPRKPNCAFYLYNYGQKVRVCKLFLINTLGITERTLRTVIQSKISGNGIAPEDKRGKHNKHRKTDEEILNAIRMHINSIPRIESHYVRSDTSRQFIDGGLSIAELYRNFSEERKACNKEVANYDTYAKIFNTEFNIGFFAPKKDQCDLCESYKNVVGDEKEKLENKYKEHLEEKVLSREEKDKDKERAKNQEIVLAVYDLQAVLPVPMGQTSAFFYKSRLNCYNFTVTEVGNDRTKAFFWHEGLGHRGAIEIGSCILTYLDELSKTRPGTHVVFFSDNCGGQQKNRFLIAVYLYAVECFAINSITHKYLVRGHTQNEGDAIHSIIERSLKKCKKSGPIYVPSQYVSVIQNAKKKGNPISVKEMGFKEFLDVKTLFDEMALNISKNTDGHEFKINDVRILQFEKNNEFFRYKTSYKQEEWKFINFRPKKRRSDFKDIKKIIIKPAYSKKIELSENKRNGLKSLLDSNIIPQFYKYFFDSLC